MSEYELFYDIERNVKMSTYELFYDTETSGFINKKLSYDDPKQSWCCQFAAILCKDGEVEDEMNMIIKANGRYMNPWLVDNVHGISAERADKEGVEEVEALEMFAKLMKDSPKRIGHNVDFDNDVIDQMFHRNLAELSDEGRSKYFLLLPSFCTMKDPEIKKFCGLKDKRGRIKQPKLTELYEILFDEPMENAHDAMVDVRATMNCYYELKRREVI